MLALLARHYRLEVWGCLDPTPFRAVGIAAHTAQPPDDPDADLDGVKDEHVRLMYGGSVEFIAGPVPIRVGGSWDGRGPGGEDDAAFVGAGAGFVQPAADGGVGWEINAGFSQQVTGERLDTVIGLSIGIRLRPNL